MEMFFSCLQPDSEPQVSDEEREKYQKEFDEYHEKLQQAKEE